MRNLVLFVFVPLAGCIYLGNLLYQRHQSETNNQDLVRAIEKFHNDKGYWPRDAASLAAYAQQPNAILLMAPSFSPINADKAYMEETTWSAATAHRQQYLVTRDSDGSCSLQSTGSL